METSAVSKGIRDLLPGIRARRDEIEKARRMPRDLVDQIRKTGVFTLGVPRSVGGQEASPLDLMRAVEAVASADGSAGWCTMIGCSGPRLRIHARGRSEGSVSRPDGADGRDRGATGAAIRGDGGVRVNGRWSYASGITHCDWVFAGCLVMENGQPRMTPHGPEIIHVWLPVANVTIHDTWYVSGLCGTGQQRLQRDRCLRPSSGSSHCSIRPGTARSLSTRCLPWACSSIRSSA